MNTPHQKGQSRSHKRKQMGQSLVEFSLILPMLLFLLLGIIDYGRILLVFSNASGATRDAARQGTLVGVVTDPQTGPNVPRYMACQTIRSLGQNVFGATIDNLDILYFNTENKTPAERATIAAALEALDPTTPATLSTADFDCDASGLRGGNPVISEDDIETGDLMVILLSARIDFITPLLSSIFPSFELTFRAQRTLVDALVLNVSGTDRDADGLLDSYELSRFGCVLDGTEGKSENEIVALMPDGSLAFNPIGGWSYVLDAPTYNVANAPQPNSPRPGTPVATSRTIPTNCAREDLSDKLFNGLTPADYDFLDCQVADPNPGTEGDTIGDCIIVATGLFSSTSDPDNDGCNNGCEQSRGTCPISNAAGICTVGGDTDGDGLSDAAEIGLRTDPNNPDTDGDGLWDGTERCEIINDIDPTICDSSPTVDLDPSDGIYPYLNGEWTNTDPLNPDSDGDLLEDGDEFAGGITEPDNGDTDGDGLDDGQEVNGFVLELEVDGLVFTVPGLVKTTANLGDSDGDGILDGAEVNGYDITYNVNGVSTTVEVKSHPLDPDTDDDGICDGNANFDSVCTGIADVNPTLIDTDNDGLTDGEEQLIYLTLPDNINSDGDTCNLTDGFEMLGDQAVASELAYGTYDLNAIDGVNAMDLESDGDGILDCVEVDTYGSNPYDPDSDLDTHTDDLEILPENWCLEIMRDDSAVILPCGGVNGGDDLDNGGTGDGFPDAWEQLYFTDEDEYDFTNPANADLDNDGCNIQCEYERRTDPTKFDTDNDGIRDGLETGSNPLIADTDGDTLIDGREGSATCIDLVALQIVNPAYTAADCYATNALLTDSDLDGLTDGAEVNGGLTVMINGSSVAVTSDPADDDTDNDGLLDGEEVNGVRIITVVNGIAVDQVTPSNPNIPDSDGDGVHDFLESRIFKTFANDSDTDNDTIQDGSTVGTTGEFPNSFDGSLPYYDTDAREADSDNDGLTDLEEINGFNVVIRVYDAGGTPTDTNTAIAGYGSNIGDQFATTNLQPRNSDTDGDGLSDGDEINVGDVTNPTLANTDGDLNGVGNPIVDGVDNCPIHVNSDQQDLDTDGIGSVCDASEAASTVYVNPITDASSLVDATNWTPSVIVRAVNTLNQPQGSVNITVTFTDPNNGGATVGTAQTCTTAAGTGQCTVNIGSQSQATFPNLNATITNLTNPPVGLAYTPANNDGPLAISVPPLSVHVETMVGAVVTGGTPSSWEAEATVTVEDDFGASVDGVDVEVTFTDSSSGLVSTETCTTAGGTGQCTVSSGVASYDGTDPSATATVTDITNLGAFGYDDTSNAAPVVITAPTSDVHVSTITGASTGTDADWEADVTVTVIDASSNPVSGVTVEVTFTDNDGIVSVESCPIVTDALGQCDVSTNSTVGNPLDATDPDVTASITDITNLGAYGYDAGSNAADIVINAPAPVGSITAQIRINDDANNQSGIHYQIINTSASAITNVSVRLYFTTDGQNVNQFRLDRDYESSGNPQIDPTGPTLHSGNIYYYTINYGTRSFPAGATWQYQMRLHLNNYNNSYDAANDWWYTGITGSYADTAYLPVYINGTLETGTTP